MCVFVRACVRACVCACVRVRISIGILLLYILRYFVIVHTFTGMYQNVLAEYYNRIILV